MTSQPSRLCCWRAVFAGAAAAGPLLTVTVAERAAAQIKSNLSSGVTSESMAAVWVARDQAGAAPEPEEHEAVAEAAGALNPKVAEVRVENLIDNSFMNKLESSGDVQSVCKKALSSGIRGIEFAGRPNEVASDEN